MKIPEIDLWTDGSGTTAGNPGGWAAVFVAYPNNLEVRKVIYGALKDTTSQRAELTAVIQGLNHLKTGCRVNLFSDSEYVVKGINEWLFKWHRWGWTTSNGEDVKNADLWEELMDALRRHTVHASHVKGHGHHELNDIADSWAGAWKTGFREPSAEETLPVD